MAVDAARLTHSLFATDHSTLIAGSGFKGRTELGAQLTACRLRDRTAS